MTQKRDDDIVIVHRFGEETRTQTVKHVYGVTYTGHDDVGSECHSRDEAEAKARDLAMQRNVSVWYEDDPRKKAGILIDSYRKPNN
jgi:hypothetical protein